MINTALDTPFKVGNLLHLLVVYPWNRILFKMNGIAWGEHWRLYGVPIIQKHHSSRIVIGDGLSLRSTIRSNPISPNHPVVLSTLRQDAVIQVGSSFYMTGGSLVAAIRITIGNHVTIGANSIIADTDFHPLDPLERLANSQVSAAEAVEIEEHVFIGMNCLVLKGVSIGKGSVIGAGSVVTGAIPPGVVAAGNPARVIRNL